MKEIVGSNNKRSLQRVVNLAILFVVCSFLLLSVIVEALTFVVPTLRFYKREMEHVGAIVTSLVGEDYINEMIEKTKEVYYSTPEEIRSDQFSDEYLECILPLIDDTYRDKRNLISQCRRKAEFESLYYMFYDEDTERYVIVFDGSEKSEAYLPGQWISNENGMVEKPATVRRTLKSDWFMPLSYGNAVGWVGTDYDNFFDSAGNITGYMVTNITVNMVSHQITVFLAIYIPVLMIGLFFLAFNSKKWVKRRFVEPITNLTECARKYSELGDLSDVDEYKFVFSDLSINTGDEIEELWETMVEMEKDIASAMKRIREETAGKERIAAELDLARDIQKGSLSMDFDAVTEGTGIRIFAQMFPAREVGGDFYDFFRIDEDHLGLVIADVSDKGVPAALFMMVSKALLRNEACRGVKKPSEIIGTVNNILSRDNPNLMFITIWLGIMDVRTGEITAANAGHEFPIVTGPDGRFKVFEEPHGMVCGCMENFEYEDYTFTIPAGGTLFVYTDGAAEAMNESDEQFGLERMEETLNRYSGLDPKELIEQLNKELDTFTGTLDPFDDTTMLAVKYN